MLARLKHKLSRRFDEDGSSSGSSQPPSPTKSAAVPPVPAIAVTAPPPTSKASSAPQRTTSAGPNSASGSTGTPSATPGYGAAAYGMAEPVPFVGPETSFDEDEDDVVDVADVNVTGAIVPRIVGGYYANWGIYGREYPPSKVPASQLTHIFYAFADVNPDTGECFLTDLWADEQIHYTGDSWNDTGNNLYGNFKQFLLMKKKNRALKLMLSVGGWSFGPHFAPMAADATKRAKFVSTALAILENDGLDGIDIDWEYPADATQAANFTQLLKQLRAGLTALAKKKNDKVPYQLSVAAPCGDQYKILQIKAMDQYLDFWNLMAYDFAGSWSSVTGHQANLWGIKGQPPSCDHAITAYMAAGVPSQKLVLGMPLYGRGFDNTDGPGQSYNGIGQGTWEAGNWDYKFLPIKGAKEIQNAKIGASYSYDSAKREFISYDTPTNCLQKCQYIKDKRLGGAMFWELSGDATKDQGGADRSLVTIASKNIGTLDSSLNHISYPGSKWDNVRAGMPS